MSFQANWIPRIMSRTGSHALNYVVFGSPFGAPFSGPLRTPPKE